MMWATILILSVLQEKVETRDLYLLHGDFCGIILSIHDLTRRSTAGTEHYCDRRDPFNSRPHTEVDYSGPGLRIIEIVFQLTTSHGGRQLLQPPEATEEPFQLTTSHGGRH